MQYPKHTLRVLLVDDDEDEYLLLRELIASSHSRSDTPRLELEWTPTYEDALRIFHEQEHDAYLVDYNLGSRDGLELLKAAEQQDLRAPVIILTGHGSYDVDLAAMQSGAADYLVKDQINLPLLERSIRYAIEQKGAQDALEIRVQERTRELQAEINRRKEVEDELRLSEMKFRTLADTTSASILIVQDGKICYANPASQYIIGYKPEELLGIEVSNLLHPAYQDTVNNENFGNNYDSEMPTRIELKVVRKDATERWVDVTAGKIEFDGRPAWLVTAFDITERDLAEQELRKAKGELEVRVEERTAELRKAMSQLHITATEAKERAEELEALNTAAKAMLSTLNLEDLLDEILDAAKSAIPEAEKGWLQLIEKGDTGELKIRAATDSDPRLRKIRLPQGLDYPFQDLKDQRPIIIHDIEKEPEYKAVRKNGSKKTPYRSAIIAPLVVEGEVLGAMSLSSSEPETFTEDDLRLLTTFSVTATSALRNAILHHEVQRLAITDSLTGCYNRRAFIELGEREVDRFRRFGRDLAAIMFDIDDFKYFNDTYGHAAGDTILKTVSERVRGCIRDIDVLARYGGDEFVILLPESEWMNIQEITNRIIQCISSQAIDVGRSSVSATVSMGATRATSRSTTLEELLAQADAALYTAKKGGKNRVEIVGRL